MSVFQSTLIKSIYLPVQQQLPQLSTSQGKTYHGNYNILCISLSASSAVMIIAERVIAYIALSKLHLTAKTCFNLYIFPFVFKVFVKICIGIQPPCICDNICHLHSKLALVTCVHWCPPCSAN